MNDKPLLVIWGPFNSRQKELSAHFCDDNFQNIKWVQKELQIAPHFALIFLGTKMYSQIAFSTPKSIHIFKINLQIGLFNSPEKWALIFLKKSKCGQNQLVRCFFGDC